MLSSANRIGTLLFGAALACSGPETPRSDAAGMSTPAVSSAVSAREAIETANARFVDALIKGDVAGMGANYTDDAVIMMPGETSWVGRAAIEANTRAMVSRRVFTDATVRTEEVLVAGDLAVERGSVTWTYTSKDTGLVTERLKYLTIWRRQADGSFRIVRDISNRDG